MWITSSFQTLLDIDQRTFGLFSKNLRRGWDHCILRFNCNFLTSFFSENYQSFTDLFWTLKEEFLAFNRKIIDQVVKTIFYVFIRTLRWLVLFWRKNYCFSSISDIERFFRPYVDIFATSCENCILRVLWSILLEIFFWRKTSPFQSFWELEKKPFSILSEYFRQVCDNCILRVPRHLPTEKN